MVPTRESAPATPEPPHGIGPVWLKSRPAGNDTRRFALPLAFRLALLRKGRAYVAVLCDGKSHAPTPDIALTLCDGAGAILAETRMAPGESALYLPMGTASITLAAPAGFAFGLFPRTKLALKLHAVAAGSFPGMPLAQRWKHAAAAARDLRGVHAALLEHSPARKAERARAYRIYRARFVEDFTTVAAPDPALELTFFGEVPADLAQAKARLAALVAQSDPNWIWRASLPANPPEAVLDWAREAGARDPRFRPEALPLEAAAMWGSVENGLVSGLPPEGVPTRDAVAMIRDAFARHPDCDLVYTDEEQIDARGEPCCGVFKPAFNRHLLQAGDYMGHLVAARARAIQQVGGPQMRHGTATRYHLLLKLAERLAPSAIRHIPRVAFTGPEETAKKDPHAAARALEEVMGTSVTIDDHGRLRPRLPLPEALPLVSFVVPTRDRADLLGMALRSLIGETDYRRFEIIIVDNGSVEPATFALFEEIKAAWPETIAVRDDGTFNYPRICNAGVAVARGSLICLLNNDIEVVDGRWLDEMVGLACAPRTGIVGAKLLFPDRSIQHAGVIVGLFRYAAHWFSHADRDLPGPFGRLVSRSNMSAVTGACLMISRACWDAIGPLDAERFAEDCNDIDLCLRARRAGYEVVFTPFACLIHHESASRGRRRSRAHRNRLKAQRRRMEELWGTPTLVDPHYNPNLSRQSLHGALAATPEGPRSPRTDAL
ncbi:MAG: glycosyltransferase family 2 protein [Pseudomonadota bacterium]